MAVDTGGQSATNIDLSAVATRGRELQLVDKFQLPPGDPLSHFAAGLAKTIASNVYLSGLSVDFAREHTGYFTAPYEHRHHVVAVEADTHDQRIQVQLDTGVARSAKINPGFGAISIPAGLEDIAIDAEFAKPELAPNSAVDWPEQVVSPRGAGVDQSQLEQALEHAFADEAMTAAFVVTHRGKLIAERYRDGIGVNTPLESWSMGKSVTATLIGRLIEQGVYDLWQPAPIPAWQGGADPRAQIRIADLLHMASGLQFRAMQDPDYEPELGYPDHLYVYTGGINAFDFCANLPQQWHPNTVGRYRNCDPVLANYLVRLAVEGRGDNYHAFPQRELFDKIGIDTMVLETDPFGNFLLQGYEFASARDWARLGNLYLNDGVWNGERLLPEGWSDFVSDLAKPWVDDGRPIYGGFFWLNGDGGLPIPKNAYWMGGAGLQRTFVIPTHDLVVVRLGHYGGALKAPQHLNNALACLMKAVPQSKI